MLAGRLADARTRADEYLETNPDDIDMLFLWLHLAYERHATGETLEPAELARFAQYAARYETLKGPQVLIVQGWRKALGIR